MPLLAVVLRRLRHVHQARPHKINKVKAAVTMWAPILLPMAAQMISNSDIDAALLDCAWALLRQWSADPEARPPCGQLKEIFAAAFCPAAAGGAAGASPFPFPLPLMGLGGPFARTSTSAATARARESTVRLPLCMLGADKRMPKFTSTRRP